MISGDRFFAGHILQIRDNGFVYVGRIFGWEVRVQGEVEKDGSWRGARITWSSTVAGCCTCFRIFFLKIIQIRLIIESRTFYETCEI